MKQTAFPKWLGLLLLIGSLLLAARVLAAGEIISRHIIPGSGGTHLAAGDLILHGALGQPVAGPVSNTNYRLCSGFWCGAAPAQGGKIYLPVVIRNWPPLYILGDAPDTCPGYGPLEFLPSQYRQSFEHTWDKDWYTFAATAGISYTIQTSALGPHADTTLELYDVGCGAKIAENDDIRYPDNIASRIGWLAPTNGTYNVRVHDYYNNYGTGTDYTLTIQENP